MSGDFLKALREYIDEVVEMAKWDAINYIQDLDEDNNYLKINKAWEEVEYQYNKEKYNNY